MTESSHFTSIIGTSRGERNQGGSSKRRSGNAAARRHLQQRAAGSSPTLNHSVSESGRDSPNGDEGDDRSSGADSDVKEETDIPKKKIGTKKAQKLAEKERRKEEREAEERYREAMRKKEDEEIRKRKEAEAKEAAAEAAQVSVLCSFL